ncbi:MAG: hypothetical protein FWE34_04460 [Defluviitaleaceae bacterium]|nr:hypothetical protein [Defluviitaleaceae bacterium]
MLKVALCKCSDSKQYIKERLASFLGKAYDFELCDFDNQDDLFSNDFTFDILMLDKSLFNDITKFHDYLKRRTSVHEENMKFVYYADNPVTELDMDRIINYLREHMGYKSMYFTVEFLTDKGLRSIAISKILFFEFHNRKIRIKTQSNEYFCNDTLKNVMDLFSKHDYY